MFFRLYRLPALRSLRNVEKKKQKSHSVSPDTCPRSARRVGGRDNAPSLVDMHNTRRLAPQEQLAQRAGTEMHRGVADIVHAVRVPGAGRVLCRAVRHAVRQALEARQTRSGRRAAAAVVRVQQSARFRKRRGRRRRRRTGQRESGGYDRRFAHTNGSESSSSPVLDAHFTRVHAECI